jgi:glycosyltransferase involved in cell wall biosynthesis
VTAAPSFSIVIPTFQRRNVVCDSVRSLLACGYEGDLELIVVVDGSTDGTATALAELKPAFPFRIVEQENSGAAVARNRGAALAKGEILLFLDDDMMAAPGLVRQHALSHSAGADAVLGHIPLDPESPPSFLSRGVARWAEDRMKHLKAGGELTLFDLLTGQLSVRRELFEALGGFDEAFTSGGQFGDEDLDFGVRLLGRGGVVFNPDAVSFQRYVVTPRQLLRQWSDAGRADVLFAAKHPGHAAQLYALHGGDRPLNRFALRPLAAIPGAGAAAEAAGIWIADRHDSLPDALRGTASRLFRISRDLVYWTGVREGARRRG